METDVKRFLAHCTEFSAANNLERLKGESQRRCLLLEERKASAGRLRAEMADYKVRSEGASKRTAALEKERAQLADELNSEDSFNTAMAVWCKIFV